MLKQIVNKNNIHIPVDVFQVLQLVAMILLINDCYVMSLVVIISHMNFVLYRNTVLTSVINWGLLCCACAMYKYLGVECIFLGCCFTDIEN